MAWKISGTYVANCSCQLICPCPVDGPPTGPGGECRGALVFDISNGNLDDTDLSGTAVALTNLFPSNLTAGNWTVGLVIDSGASDEQSAALESIFKGEVGGPFALFADLTSDWFGIERGEVSLTAGDTPSAKIGTNTITFQPLEGPEGSGTQTTVKNGAFGFAPEYRIGTAPAAMNVVGNSFEAVYGESADYEFASEMDEGAAPGRA